MFTGGRKKSYPGVFRGENKSKMDPPRFHIIFGHSLWGHSIIMFPRNDLGSNLVMIFFDFGNHLVHEFFRPQKILDHDFFRPQKSPGS